MNPEITKSEPNIDISLHKTSEQIGFPIWRTKTFGCWREAEEVWSVVGIREIPSSKSFFYKYKHLIDILKLKENITTQRGTKTRGVIGSSGALGKTKI